MVVKSYTNITDGQEVRFHCKEGFVPRNIVTSICEFHNGNWSPDPNEYECKSLLITEYILTTFVTGKCIL